MDDLDEFGSEAAIKAAGRMRTEGRDYALAEGDVCHFLIGPRAVPGSRLKARPGLSPGQVKNLKCAPGGGPYGRFM